MIRNLEYAKPRPVTAQRELIWDILQETVMHIDAKELYRRAVERDPRISVSTVYRSLRLFKEMGLIDERQLGQVRCYYEVKRQDEHHHLVCQGCGRVIEFESLLIQRLMMEVQRKNRFQVTGAKLYLEGYCEECEKEESTTAK